MRVKKQKKLNFDLNFILTCTIYMCAISYSIKTCNYIIPLADNHVSGLPQDFMQRMPLMWLVERWLGKLIISERQKMDSTLGESESQEPFLSSR